MRLRCKETTCACQKAGRIRNGHNVTVSTQMTKQTFHQLSSILLTELCRSKEISGMTLSTTCHSDGSEIDCSGHLLPGTTATIYCHAGYVKPPSGVIRDLTCLPSGEWSHQVHQCLPNCGIASKSSNKLQIGGSFWFSFSLNFLSIFPSNHQSNPRLGTWRSTRMAHKSVAERSSRSALWSAPLTASPWPRILLMQSTWNPSKWPLGRSSKVWVTWTRQLLSSGTFRRSEFL